MNYKNLIFIVALIVVTTFLSTHYAAHPPVNETQAENSYERVMRTRTLRCGYYLWPVTVDMDPNSKKLSGLVPDMVEALGEQLGLKIEWAEEVPLDQIAAALSTKRFDAVCAPDGPWVYAEAAVVDWTKPLAYFPVYLFGRKGETRFKNDQDINQPHVIFSSLDGDISTTLASEKFPKARKLQLGASGDPTLVVQNVLSKKADLLIEDALTVARVNSTNKEQLIKMREQPYSIISMSLTTRKGDEQLRHMLDQGIDLLQARGISDQILDHYDPHKELFYRPAKPWSAPN